MCYYKRGWRVGGGWIGQKWVGGWCKFGILSGKRGAGASELQLALLQSNFSFSFRNLLAAAPLKPRGAKCSQRAREHRVGSERERAPAIHCAQQLQGRRHYFLYGVRWDHNKFSLPTPNSIFCPDAAATLKANCGAWRGHSGNGIIVLAHSMNSFNITHTEKLERKWCHLNYTQVTKISPIHQLNNAFYS